MAVSAKREATTRKSAKATPRFDDSTEGRSIEVGHPEGGNLRGSGWSTLCLPGLNRLLEAALDQQGREVHRVRDPLRVDELRPLGRQLVLLVAEMRDRGGGDPLLVEGKGVDPGTGWADAQLVPLTQAELVGEGRETVGKGPRRGHQLQLVAVRDAVEVDTGLDSPELARDLRVEDPRTRAD